MMKAIIYILTTLLLYPYFIGLLWNRLDSKRVPSVANVFAMGYLTQFAIFEMIAVPMLARGFSVSSMGRIWLIVVTGLAVVGLIFGFKDGIRNVFRSLNQMCTSKWYMKALLLGMLLLVVFSVLWVQPSLEDSTVEVILTNQTTGTYYEYGPYSGMPYGGRWIAKTTAPTELYYTMLIERTGVDVSTFIYVYVRISLLLFFYCVMWSIGAIAFDENKNKFEVDVLNLKKGDLYQTIYMVIVLMISTISLIMPRSAIISVFQNIWMDRTLLFTCIAPMILYLVYQLDNDVEQGLRIPYKYYIPAFIVTVLSAQLMHYYSWIWFGVIIVIAIIIAVARNLYLRRRRAQ